MNKTGWNKNQQENIKVVARKRHQPFQRQTHKLDHITTVHCGNAAVLPTIKFIKVVSLS